VHLFSPTSLGLALDRAGFVVQDVRSRRGDAHGTGSELMRIVAKRLSRHRPRASVTGVAPPRHLAARIDRILDVVTGPVDFALARGRLAMPEMVVIASPRG
jgi:hypothetical protein